MRAEALLESEMEETRLLELVERENRTREATEAEERKNEQEVIAKLEAEERTKMEELAKIEAKEKADRERRERETREAESKARLLEKEAAEKLGRKKQKQEDETRKKVEEEKLQHQTTADLCRFYEISPLLKIGKSDPNILLPFFSNNSADVTQLVGGKRMQLIAAVRTNINTLKSLEAEKENETIQNWVERVGKMGSKIVEGWGGGGGVIGEVKPIMDALAAAASSSGNGVVVASIESQHAEVSFRTGDRAYSGGKLTNTHISK